MFGGREQKNLRSETLLIKVSNSRKCFVSLILQYSCSEQQTGSLARNFTEILEMGKPTKG